MLPLLAFVALAALLRPADAHAGHFHRYPDTPSGNNYWRFEVGNCSSFVSLNGSSNMAMTGKVTVWLYDYQNCTDRISTALEFDTVLTQNGAPVTNYTTTGYAHEGTCANLGAKYLQDAAAGEAATNMIWWNGFASGANGSFRGNAANSIVLRSIDQNGNVEANALSNVVIYTPDFGPTLCCDLAMSPKPPISALLTGSPGVGPCISPPPTAALPAPPPTGIVPSPSPGRAVAPRAPLAWALTLALAAAAWLALLL